MARSIAQGANYKMIPYANYLKGICPISNNKLPIPNTAEISQYTSNYDYDEDGIPDVIEKKYGLNPEDKNDALYDADNDSFPNISEYNFNKESVLAPNMHPPLITRIVLEEIASTKIPIEIENIIRHGYNKDNWRIQTDIYTPQKGWRTKFLKIGDKFSVNGINYVIKDIKESFDTVINPKLGGTSKS